jgi:hypothetical protein
MLSSSSLSLSACLAEEVRFYNPQCQHHVALFGGERASHSPLQPFLVSMPVSSVVP